MNARDIEPSPGVLGPVVDLVKAIAGGGPMTRQATPWPHQPEPAHHGLPLGVPVIQGQREPG